MAYQNFPNYGYYPQSFYGNTGAVPDVLNQYKTPYQQVANVPAPAPATNNNDMIWVQGESGAKAYLVAPNTTVTLWDSENKTIYIKTADNTGVPSMRIFDYNERNAAPKEEHVCKCSTEFAPIEDFKKLETRLEELTEKVNSITPKTTKTKGAADNA